MHERMYLSNIAAGWPRERQLAVIGEPGKRPIYEDKLPQAALARLRKRDKREPVDALPQRDKFLLRRMTRRAPEVIVAASPVCLVVDWEDFARVIAAAAARNATIRFADGGLEIPPHPEAEAIAQAMAAFGKARGTSRTEPGRKLGREVSLENRRADTERRIGLIRDRWGDPAWATAALLLEAGPRPGVSMAYQLAALHLGKRPIAIAAWKRKHPEGSTDAE